MIVIYPEVNKNVVYNQQNNVSVSYCKSIGKEDSLNVNSVYKNLARMHPLPLGKNIQQEKKNHHILHTF